MLRVKSRVLLLVLLVLLPGVVLAQKSAVKRLEAEAKKDVELSTEFGLGVGAQYNWFSTQNISEGMTAQFKYDISYGAALQFRVNVGKYFGIQPEVTYSHGRIRISDEPHSLSKKAQLNLVQVPLLLSVKIAMFRINAGPVFTLIDSPYYTLTYGDDVQKCYLGRIFPTVTYTAGVSVKFAGCMMLDLRYLGQFMEKKAHCEYLYSFNESEQQTSQLFKTRIGNVQARFSYVF